MTTTRIATVTCDPCGRRELSLGEHCGGPLRWAQVTWEEPPEDGKHYRQYKEMDLCPDHLNEFLKWVAAEQEKQTFSAT